MPLAFNESHSSPKNQYNLHQLSPEITPPKPAYSRKEIRASMALLGLDQSLALTDLDPLLDDDDNLPQPPSHVPIDDNDNGSSGFDPNKVQLTSNDRNLGFEDEDSEIDDEDEVEQESDSTVEPIGKGTHVKKVVLKLAKSKDVEKEGKPMSKDRGGSRLSKQAVDNDVEEVKELEE